MVTIQANGLLEDQEVSSLEQADVRYASLDLENPVRYEGESVFFRRELMKEDLPYLFTFQGKKALVIRKGDELDFYSFE